MDILKETPLPPLPASEPPAFSLRERVRYGLGVGLFIAEILVVGMLVMQWVIGWWVAARAPIWDLPYWPWPVLAILGIALPYLPPHGPRGETRYDPSGNAWNFMVMAHALALVVFGIGAALYGLFG